jgi:hypothetical protein
MQHWQAGQQLRQRCTGEAVVVVVVVVVRLLPGCIAELLAVCLLGVFVTREHVGHNKSGIAHWGKTRINHLRELPTKLNHFAAVGRLPCPAELVNHRCTVGVQGADKLGKQPVVPKVVQHLSTSRDKSYPGQL